MLFLGFIVLHIICILITVVTVTLNAPLETLYEINVILVLIRFLSLFSTTYLIGGALQAVTGKYSGEIWGYKISMPKSVVFLRIIGIIGGLVSLGFIIFNFWPILYGAIDELSKFFVGLFKIAFTLNFKDYFLWTLVFMFKVFVLYSGFYSGFKLFVKIGLKLYSVSPCKDIKKLENISILESIDHFVDLAKMIHINGNEIILTTFDDQYMHFTYDCYGLDPLIRTVAAYKSKNVASFEVALLGLYFANKYKKDFKFKVNKTFVEGLEGTPGEMLRVVTPKGVYYVMTSRSSGIPDKKPFNGYTFIRKETK